MVFRSCKKLTGYVPVNLLGFGLCLGCSFAIAATGFTPISFFSFRSPGTRFPSPPLSQDLHAKLADFDMALPVPVPVAGGLFGTPGFMPPEV